LLSLEPNHYPQDLFTEPVAEAVEGRLWRVLHTKPRQEKSLARQLFRARVPFYLPLSKRRCLVRGRTLHSYVPLFPGYVFLQADRDERVAALATQRVVRCLEVPDQEGLWRDLSQVERLLASGLPVTPEGRLIPGTPVEITGGPLAGLQGIIVREASGGRFIVQVDFIQQGASVLLDDFFLESLPGAAARG
jgi:transcriptional antiterminator RfaH